MLDVEVSLRRGVFLLNGIIHDGGSICLSGFNGSGKSTLLSVLAGRLAPDSGYVRINSKDVTRVPPELREVVLVSPESQIPHFDVEKHLRWGAGARGVRVDEGELKELKDSLGIDYGGRVDKLSLGMRERVALASALLSKPKVLLVDEAFSNIDNKTEFIGNFRTFCGNSNVDLVYTTQQEADAAMSDHHYRITEGSTKKFF